MTVKSLHKKYDIFLAIRIKQKSRSDERCGMENKIRLSARSQQLHDRNHRCDLTNPKNKHPPDDPGLHLSHLHFDL